VFLFNLPNNAKTPSDALRLLATARVVQTVKLVRLEEFLHLAEDLDKAVSQFAT
jgi:hypothetical protein